MAERLPFWGFVLTVLRMHKGWGVEELARALRMDKGNLSRRVRNPTLSRAKMERLAAPMQVTREEIELALDFARNLAAAGEDGREERRLEQLLANLGRQVAEACRPGVVEALLAKRAARERRHAETLWKRLAARPAADRLSAVSEEAVFGNWAVVERICAASEKAAAHEAKEALKLAELALAVARKTPAERGGSPVLEAYATAAVGNARRVGNDLDGADAAFARARELDAQGPGKAWAPLDPARRLDLEASLRCDQERWEEALELLEQALEACPADARARVLLKKAATLGHQGKAAQALSALEEAAAWVDQTREPRQAWGIQFNRIVNLGLLGCWEKSAELLSAVRERAIELGYDLDLIRLLWLDARIHAGRGELEEARRLFDQARQGFAARNMAVDLALVALDLARLHLQAGETVAVKALARQVARVCRENQLHEKAAKALVIFYQAAEREQVTSELLERTASAISKARKAA